MCGLDTHRVENGVDCHSRQMLLLFERDAELVEGLYQFRIHLIHALLQFLLLGCRIVADRLIVDVGYIKVSPGRRGERLPVAIGFQTIFQQPLRLLLERRYLTDHILIETGRHYLCLDIGCKPIFIFRICSLFDHAVRTLCCFLLIFFHFFSIFAPVLIYFHPGHFDNSLQICKNTKKKCNLKAKKDFPRYNALLEHFLDGVEEFVVDGTGEWTIA